MCVAISRVSGTPSSRIRSNTISPQAAADTSNQLSDPYIELPRWWSMLMTNPRSSPATPVRSRLPDSMTRTASPGSSTRSATSMSETPGNTSRGGGAGSRLTIRTSLPRCRSAYAMASADPIASPSGRMCDVITKRWRARIASATCARVAGSVAVGVIGCVGVLFVEVAQDLLDAVLMGNRLVEAEVDLGHAPQPQPAGNLPPEKRRGALERLRGFLAGLRVAKRRVKHVRHLQICRHPHARHRDEADARIVDVAAGEHRAQLLADLVANPSGTEALSHDVCTVHVPRTCN